MTSPIPTNLVLGFLGVGKTTAILDLLKKKPEGEVWAVLVNEFGEVGIDGALLETEGAFVREVPGGCMCCVAGLPMQIGLNQLIHKARPDRLLIEPTGLGHPSQIIETLTGEHYQDVLQLGPVLCLVDPRRLEEQKVLENVQFQDQVAAADIVIANKTDLCTPEQVARFDHWVAEQQPGKTAVFHTRQGRLESAWLDGETALSEVSTPHAHHHHASSEASPVPDIQDEPWQRVSNRGQGHFSVGWRVHPDTVFSETALLALSLDSRFVRFKAVAQTNDGWRTINMADGALSVSECEPRELSRLEVISEQSLDVDELDASLRESIEKTSLSCLKISNAVELGDWEIELTQIRAQGAGGQNVNKVASAVHLRFDVLNSSLPPFYKERLMRQSDQRISKEGVIVIKAQKFRTLELNKEDALERLKALIQDAVKQQKARRPTRPTKGSQRRRVDKKTRKGKTKALRGKVPL